LWLYRGISGVFLACFVRDTETSSGRQRKRLEIRRKRFFDYAQNDSKEGLRMTNRETKNDIEGGL
jgi:hypothetical protein